MQRIKAKLNSKRGVSLMMALLLFLMCALSGAAAITAAGSNIGRYSYMREYQQEYLSVSSAAKLLKTQFEKGTGNISADCSSGSAVEELGSILTTNPVYALIVGDMQTLLYDAYLMSTGVEPAGTIYSASPKEFEIEVDGDGTFKTVDASIKFNKPTNSGNNADIDVEVKSGEHTLAFVLELSFTYEETGKIKVSEAKVARITLPKS